MIGISGILAGGISSLLSSQAVWSSCPLISCHFPLRGSTGGSERECTKKAQRPIRIAGFSLECCSLGPVLKTEYAFEKKKIWLRLNCNCYLPCLSSLVNLESSMNDLQFFSTNWNVKLCLLQAANNFLWLKHLLVYPQIFLTHINVYNHTIKFLEDLLWLSLLLSPSIFGFSYQFWINKNFPNH